MDVGVTGYLASQNSPDIHPTLPYVSTIARVPSLTINSRAWSAAGPLYVDQYTHQAFVNVTHTAGKQTLYLGGNLEFYVYGKNQGTTNAGAYTFTNNSLAFSSSTSQFEQAFAQFLLGQVSSFQQTSTDAANASGNLLLEGYFQDDFHPTPRLTLNGGLRYFFKQQPTIRSFEGHPELAFSNFDPASYSPAQAPTINSSGLICTTNPCAGGGTPNAAYNPQNGLIIAGANSPFGNTILDQPLLNFAPRIGFAYDVFGKARTSLRGGYGIYYVPLSNSIFQSIPASNPPNVATTTITNTSLDAPGNGIPSVSSAPLLLTSIGPGTKTPYVQDWNLDLQHQFPRGVLADVGYYANHAVHQLGTIDLNQPQVGAYVGNTSIAAGGVTAAKTTILNRVRPYQGWGSINETASLFSGEYNGLQTSLTKRFTGPSLINVNYTYSKALSNTQGDGSSPQNIYDLRAEYGPALYDRRHLFSADFIYEEPFFAHSEAVVRSLLAGWEVTGIITAGSGLFATAATSAQDPGGIGLLAASAAASARPDQISNPNAGAPHKAAEWFSPGAFAPVPTGQARVGDAPVNSILGPGYENVDLSLLKNTRLFEALSTQLRFEAFNAFNHTNFQSLNTTVGSSGFGEVTGAATARILQIGAKFEF